MKYDTIREAAEAWVHEMSAIPRDMIAKLIDYEPEEWKHVTPPTIGSRVYVYDTPTNEHSGDVVSYIGDGFYKIELDDGTEMECGEDDMEPDADVFSLPAWGTMWSFNDSADEYWLTELGGLQAMAECGFDIFESEEFGYFFGIDGAGYSFYEEHWIPLYKARGLHWHKEEDAA